MNNLNIVKEKICSTMPSEEIAYGEILFNNFACQILSQSPISIDFLIENTATNEFLEYSLIIEYINEDNSTVTPKIGNKFAEWDRYSYACLLQYEQELNLLSSTEKIEHKKYTRQGMIKRVIEERQQKATQASYRIKWAENIYGNHTLINEQGLEYQVFLRDFETETGYSDSWDSKLNKLGTTKHIMYVFNELKKKPEIFDKLDKTYPFIEIFCDPLNEYKITWHYPHELPLEEQLLITRHFKNRNYIENEDLDIKQFLDFISQALSFETICIRPEVRAKVERVFDSLLRKKIEETKKPDYSIINAELFPYQKEGIEFALYKDVAIIADEMGLGKTVQATSTAVLKKQIFGFNKTLVVCPASLKSQWKAEIEKFTNEKALVISGTPKERAKQYEFSDHFFFIINYETILRDSYEINLAGFDFLILDEAQKIKNYETKTSAAIKRLQVKHTLVITGTPIENRLIDIFSIVGVLDPYFFGPLWEFSYQHCLFDAEKINKINGYYNLQSLNNKLSKILIRREKRDVLEQLPNVTQVNVPIEMSPAQAEYHSSYAKGIAAILRKKFLTAYDMQKMQLLLSSMRMVCDSTYLIDDKTNVSPKMNELEHILFEKLDLKNTNRKIIIFSEWVKVHKLIGKMLRDNRVGFVELNGKVPVKARGALIKKFEESTECKIFLSTEAGGAGLNLQVADTLINFELPWNPAKKNQRIGRIDRLGQKSHNLTIYNFITRDSIEQQIAAGLLVKQNLFEGVLDNNSSTDYVDFSSKGRSQFIDQLEVFINQTESEKNDVNGKTKQEAFDLESDDGLLIADAKDKQDQKVNTIEAIAKNSKTAELEQVMTSGMQFLAGLFKMSTGKEMETENQKIKINQETGEVTMTFKLPI